MILLFNSFGLAHTLKRSTALSMFYIACCGVVLMHHNVPRLNAVGDLEHEIINLK